MIILHFNFFLNIYKLQIKIANYFIVFRIIISTITTNYKNVNVIL